MFRTSLFVCAYSQGDTPELPIQSSYIIQKQLLYKYFVRIFCLKRQFVLEDCLLPILINTSTLKSTYLEKNTSHSSTHALTVIQNIKFINKLIKIIAALCESTQVSHQANVIALLKISKKLMKTWESSYQHVKIITLS